MREILFRGKAVNRNENYSYRTNYKNGDWVYGLLADVNEYAGFSEMTNTDGVSGIEVDTKTVGQYTGLKDKNGQRIFDDDILTIYDGSDTNTGVVEYDDNAISYIVNLRNGKCYAFIDIRVAVQNNNDIWIKKVGNIHDNPELLKGGVE